MYPPCLKMQTKVPFVFQANLALKRERGQVALNLQGGGPVTFAVNSTHDPDVLLVRLRAIDLMLEAMDIEFPYVEGDVEKGHVLRVPETRLGCDVFNIDACKGQLNIKTGECTFKLVLVLRHEQFPQLAEFGVRAPLSVEVTENGFLDLKTGMVETHASSFYVADGLMSDLIVHPGGPDEKPAIDFYNKTTKCDAKIMAAGVYGLVDPNRIQSIIREARGELTICPGKQVTLGWTAEGKNTRWSSPLDPPTQVTNEGFIVVEPPTDTEYTFTTEGNQKSGDKFCTNEATVKVRVVKPGQTLSLGATNVSGTTAVWTVRVSELTTDPDIFVTSIRTVTCALATDIILRWNCTHTNPNGHVADFPVTTAFQSPFGPNDVQYVGLWEFKPDLIGEWRPTPGSTACFEVTVACR